MAAGSVTPPPATTAPAAPSSLTAKAVSTSEVQLTWKDNSTNEGTFRIEVLFNGAYVEITNVPANSTTVKIGGLAAGTAYTFRVRAANSAGYSAYSNTASATTLATPPPTATTAPAAPSSLTAKAVSTSEIQLTWKDNSTNEGTFRIEVLFNGVYVEITNVPANSTTVKIGGLAAGTAYMFRVRAANSAGYSAYSNTATATTTRSSATPPASPTGFQASWGGGTLIKLTWSDNSGNESNFRVEQMINGVYKEVLVVGANTTSATFVVLRSGASYTFRVRASNSAGYSSYSNADNVNTF
jgi:titin